MNLDRPSRTVPALLGLGIVLGFAYNAVGPDPVPWIATAKAVVHLEDAAPAPGDTLGLPESEFPITVSLEKTKELFDSGRIRILDARDPEEYAEGHIAGAECAPYDEVSGDDAKLQGFAEDPRPIVVYCDGGGCELSIDLGFAISQAGHRRVLVFEEGYPVWAEAGYPTHTGDQP